MENLQILDLGLDAEDIETTNDDCLSKSEIARPFPYTVVTGLGFPQHGKFGSVQVVIYIF